MGNSVRQDGPYPHADVEAIAAFLNDGLAAVARDIDALSITTHGATGALLRGDGLALPVLDYEHAGPDALAEAYDRVRPGFAETFSPRLRGGLNLGAQLFWQAHAFPQVFAVADAFVTYPQYWAWRLTGVAATEATSLGCHTDLWAPGRDRVSSLVETQGWTGLLAPLRSAFDRIGPLRPELAARLGLRPGLPVACGIHDSNASLLPHLQRGRCARHHRVEWHLGHLLRDRRLLGRPRPVPRYAGQCRRLSSPRPLGPLHGRARVRSPHRRRTCRARCRDGRGGDRAWHHGPSRLRAGLWPISHPRGELERRSRPADAARSHRRQRASTRP